ncbi:MAG: uroporphyrinogen-III synthase, partial [Planctomycetaceae bacterium]
MSTTHPTVRVLSFESRRAEEMRSLIERLGGIATVAPSMREVPLTENAEPLRFAESLLAGEIDVMVFLTGVGARALLEAVEERHDRSEFLAALDKTTTIVRGPKPTAVLREWGVRIDHRAPEPNTWRELIAVIDAAVPVSGKTIAVQEYGEANDEFYEALRQRGAHVRPVPVYRWAFPEDIGPLKTAIRATLRGEFDAILITSAQQIVNVLQVAEREGLRDEWIAAARKCVIGSIGPTASEKLVELGLPPDLEASPPKMGILARVTV